MRHFEEVQSKVMRAYAQCRQYHNIVESRIYYKPGIFVLIYKNNIIKLYIFNFLIKKIVQFQPKVYIFRVNILLFY